jgi:hypothetical protein
MRQPPDTLVLDLKRRMRCRDCDAKGKAVVSIKWDANPRKVSALLPPEAVD